MVVGIFSYVLSWVFSYTLSFFQSAYSRRPPIFLGGSLDMVWALCYQLRFRSGLIPVCIFFQSRASSQLQGFNLLLLWLQETMFFFFGHTAFMHHFALCFCLHLCLYASSHLSSPPRKEQVKTKSA